MDILQQMDTEMDMAKHMETQIQRWQRNILILQRMAWQNKKGKIRSNLNGNTMTDI